MFEKSKVPVMVKLRIFLADDHPVVRSGLKGFIDSQPDMEVIGEAWDGSAAVRSSLEMCPDVVVMDVSMPGLSGHEATRRIRTDNPTIKVLALTGHEDRGYLQLLLGAGAQGYVQKSAATTDLLRAIRAVASGELYIDPAAAANLVAIVQPSQPSMSTTELSDRETEVLRSIAQGHLLKQIANRLGVGLRTVETYKVRAMEKLGLKSRADIVRHAVHRGWLGAQ
jgi:DNA-binding NarL/FixJ family response regulator